MGILTLFSRKAPSIGGIQFDATMETATSKSVTLTEFPVEFGVNINNHRIKNPDRHLITGMISNTKLGFDLNDVGYLGAGLVSSTIGGVAGGLVGGISAYLLAGSEETRAQAAWEALSQLMISGEAFDLDDGHAMLYNMVLVRLDKRQVPQNEDSLEFVAELRQLITVFTQLVQTGVQSKQQLAADSQQPVPSISRGEVPLMEQ